MATQPIDPTCKILRPLGEYAGRLPSSRPGKTIHKATLGRWANHGASGVVLRTEILGGCRFTCDAYLAEFMRRLGQGRRASRRASSARRCPPREADRERILDAFQLPGDTARAPQERRRSAHSSRTEQPGNEPQTSTRGAPPTERPGSESPLGPSTPPDPRPFGASARSAFPLPREGAEGEGSE